MAVASRGRSPPSEAAVKCVWCMLVRLFVRPFGSFVCQTLWPSRMSLDLLESLPCRACPVGEEETQHKEYVTLSSTCLLTISLS